MIDGYLEAVGKAVQEACPSTPVYVKVSCEFCGEEHEELMVDGHISKPHLCDKCWKKGIEELKQWGYRP